MKIAYNALLFVFAFALNYCVFFEFLYFFLRCYHFPVNKGVYINNWVWILGANSSRFYLDHTACSAEDTYRRSNPLERKRTGSAWIDGLIGRREFRVFPERLLRQAFSFDDVVVLADNPRYARCRFAILLGVLPARRVADCATLAPPSYCSRRRAVHVTVMRRHRHTYHPRRGHSSRDLT